MAPLSNFGPFSTSLTSANATPVNTALCGIPTSCVMVIEATVAAKSGSLNGAGYTLAGTFKNAAGTVAQVGATVATVVNEDAALVNCAVAFSVSGTQVRLTTTGIAATTIDWTLVAYLTQV